MDEAKKDIEPKEYNGGDDSSEEKYRIYSLLAFITVVILFGVPMWWKTTEVYRVSLPSGDIMDLSTKPIKTTVRFGIYTAEEQRAKLLIKELTEAFINNDLWNLEFIEIPRFEKASSAKTPIGLESLILKHYQVNAGDFLFIEWSKLQEDVLMTNERSALIRKDTSAKKLVNVINFIILQTHRIKEILSDGQRNVKSEAPQLEYDVVVSVLNPNPESMDAKWNVQMAVETYIVPFLDEVSHISNYTLRTQWKYQLPIEGDLKQIRDSSKLGRHYALSETSLPHIITSIERNLGVGITAKPAINLVVYIPPCHIAPIHIYNRKNELATRQQVDSFISPKWGGIIIANPPQDTCLKYNELQQPASYYVSTNDVMQIMLHQLHKLLDISVEINMDGVKTEMLEQLAPRRWEYEAYIRRSALMHLTTATNTLQSLIKLLDNISYIVINDEVGAAINNAFEHIQSAKEALQKNQLLRAADLAKIAFASSERAFFDASLLAQLYFPDEQKYAIYIPLFLPIMVPVISSFSMLRKFFAKWRESQKLKTT